MINFILLIVTFASSWSSMAQQTEGLPEKSTVLFSQATELAAAPKKISFVDIPVNFHGQTTYINQRYPNFNAPYSGPNSLQNQHALSYTWSGTLFMGARILPDTDVYFNPEVFSGVPFSRLTGLGGFSNGEANKAAGAQAQFYSARAFLRHTVNLHGENVFLEDEANQIAQTVSSRRVVVTAGQFSTLDIFDDSRYAKDPRTQFLNWGNLSYLAYDYAADSRGYGWGLASEWYANNWVFRASRMTTPKEPNGQALDWHILRHYGDQVEIERSHALDHLPGKVSLLAYRNKMVLALFSDATHYVVQNNAQGTQAITQVRSHAQSKSGIGVNAEQAFAKDAGLYLRVFQSDGKSETMSFTEADYSVAIGAGIQGYAWQRPLDTLGISLMRHGLSQARKQYLQAGGISYFIGDYASPTQTLTYKPEQIFEIYYNTHLLKKMWGSLNLQHIQNPAYNAARGPAHVLSFRIHAEF